MSQNVCDDAFRIDDDVACPCSCVCSRVWSASIICVQARGDEVLRGWRRKLVRDYRDGQWWERIESSDKKTMCAKPHVVLFVKW